MIVLLPINRLGNDLRIILIAFLMAINVSFCDAMVQEDKSAVFEYYKYFGSSIIPNTLQTHPLGMYIGRIPSNYKLSASSKKSISVQLSNGNVWLPYVKGYIPLRESDRNAMKLLDWHLREGPEILKAPAKTIELNVDGVVRMVQIEACFPFSSVHEMKVNARGFSYDAGRVPFSGITSDQFIEWFHSNLFGGEDPFGRKHYGYNNTAFSYTDQQGKSFHVDPGKFVFTGIDISYHRYPKLAVLKGLGFLVNYGMQLGLNTTKVNPALDLGMHASVNKLISFGRKSNLHLGSSFSFLRQRVVLFAEGVQISENPNLFSAGLVGNYTREIGKQNFLSVGISSFWQSAYNNPEVKDYIVLTGERVSSHWHYAVSHLYRPLRSSSLFFTYSCGKYAFWICLREDTLVDNAPDAETMIGVRRWI